MRILLIVVACMLSSFAKPDLEQIKYENYLFALNNDKGGMAYYVVVRVKDLNTGTEKEICTNAAFLEGAISKELGDTVNYEKVIEIARQNQSRYFEFRNMAALENISFYTYDIGIAAELAIRKGTIDSIREVMLPGADIENVLCMALTQSENASGAEKMAMAHIAFNMGYLASANTCAGGQLMVVPRHIILKGSE